MPRGALLRAALSAGGMGCPPSSVQAAAGGPGLAAPVGCCASLGNDVGVKGGFVGPQASGIVAHAHGFHSKVAVHAAGKPVDAAEWRSAWSDKYCSHFSLSPRATQRAPGDGALPNAVYHACCLGFVARVKLCWRGSAGNGFFCCWDQEACKPHRIVSSFICGD